jgi:Ca-activated chloride channel family protein
MRMAALLILLVLARLGWAQSEEPSRRDATPTIRVDSQFVLIDALVENKKTGSSIDTLTAKDFQLSEDGVPQTISYFSRDQLPLSVVFLFDMTETVHAALKPLAQAALAILGHLKPQDEVAVMIFSSRTELLQDFTVNRSLAADAVKTASWMADVEGTFIDEDMYEAVNQALKTRLAGSRRVLVWLTDGTANYENSFTQSVIGQHSPARLHTQQEALVKLLQSEVVVSALIDRTAETNAAIMASNMGSSSFLSGTRVGDIQQYANATGGPVLSTDTKEAADRLALLLDQIRARYTLGYKPADTKPHGTFCKLSLQFSPEFRQEHPELRKPGLILLAKQGYYR